jgi:hypothetical protein
MGLFAYHLFHMLGQFYFLSEEVKRSMKWLMKDLIKVRAKVAYHSQMWYVHVASALLRPDITVVCLDEGQRNAG